MEKATLSGFGKGGFNVDLPPWEVPPHVFNIANNVRTHDGAIGNINCGYTTWYPDLGSTPLDIIYCTTPGTDGHWISASATQIESFENVVIGSGYTATYWTSTILTGVPVFNTNTEAPLYWPEVNTGISLANLPWDSSHDWDDTDGAGTQYRADVIRAHGSFLFAIGVYEGAGPIDLVNDRLSTTVHWSDTADPGFPPPNWRYDDPTSLSGRRDIGETKGKVIDGLSLGNDFIVYKTDSAWKFSFIGGQFIFRVTRVKECPGIMSRDCVVEAFGIHYVMSNNDIYLTDGTSFESLLTDRVRKNFLALVDSDKKEDCHVSFNEEDKEGWFNIATSGATPKYPNVALVWSIEDQTWPTRQYPGLVKAVSGEKDPEGAILINNYVGLINEANRLINEVSESPGNQPLIGPMEDNSIVEFDTGPDNDGVPFESRMTKHYLAVIDAIEHVTIDRGFLHFDWISGNPNIEVRIGGLKNTQNKVPSWNQWKTFDMTNQRHVGLRKTAPYFSLDFRSTVSNNWRFTGGILEFQKSGQR